jgi:SAM-dependent methyltransferase
VSADRVHARERAFYDAQAAAPPDERLDPDGFARALLGHLGPLAGARVLDAGCGTGDLTLLLARAGAEVTALDLSAGMAERTAARAQADGVGDRVRTVVAPLESTGLPDDAFDAVAGKWVLHHADVPRATAELARVLKPGGRGAFFENLDANPLLRLARRRVLGRLGTRRLGTTDERPLTASDLEAIRAAFGELTLHHPTFHFFELLSSRALGYRLHRPLRALDAQLHRVKPLRRFSYHAVVAVRRSIPRP